jgi:hypothetical protein
VFIGIVKWLFFNGMIYDKALKTNKRSIFINSCGIVQGLTWHVAFLGVHIMSKIPTILLAQCLDNQGWLAGHIFHANLNVFNCIYMKCNNSQNYAFLCPWGLGLSASQAMISPHAGAIYCNYIYTLETRAITISGARSSAGQLPLPPPPILIKSTIAWHKVLCMVVFLLKRSMRLRLSSLHDQNKNVIYPI